MTRRISLAALFLFVCGFVAYQSVAVDTGFWWHNLLTQKGRNDAILRQALSYPNGKYIEGECKNWVRRVVSESSKGLINIPSTVGNSSWEFSPDVGTYSPAFPAPGDIIQMQWNSGPHTMIVVSSDTRGLNVIDCNWYSSKKETYSCVFRHSITWAEFRTKAAAYSVYYIK